MADTEVNLRCPSASRVDELQPKIHPEICQRDSSTDGMTEEIRDFSRQEIGRLHKLGMHSESQVSVQKPEKDLHQSTDPAAFRSGQADHSPNGHEWI